MGTKDFPSLGWCCESPSTSKWHPARNDSLQNLSWVRSLLLSLKDNGIAWSEIQPLAEKNQRVTKRWSY
jgi:hypothetical protein